MLLAVYKGAGEQNMSGEIRCLLGAVADLSRLVLHTLHLLHWGVTGVTCSRSAALEIRQVRTKPQKFNNNVRVLGSHGLTVRVANFHRRKCFLFNNFVAIFGSVLMLFSQKAMSFEMIMAGRFLYGLNAGEQ